MDKQQKERVDRHAIDAQIILAATSAEGEVEETDTFVLGYTGVGLATYNFMLPLSLAGLTDDTLADTDAFFDSRNTKYAIALEEHRVTDGTEYLSNRRYQPFPPQPMMVLENLPTNYVKQNNLHITDIATVPDMAAFYTVLDDVYDFSTDEVTLLFPTSQLKSSQVKHFVGLANNETPATAGTAVYSNNVVSLWNLSTRDNYRRQGLATTLVNYILVDAAKQGCNLSVVYATPMGFSLFNDLGYKLHAMRQWFVP